ncbi:hypothetical protein BD626DRAFT_492713 [Schizophyllum amplum]|uniref:F-box domain-containing protein n=1 Tax=Schizophyllum amplum TaxID=97359 RepID=A0A550CG63_9AGAR|nr:hypothetical protein BD626DRAFT_492713 [Auriculariopsis ampla]
MSYLMAYTDMSHSIAVNLFPTLDNAPRLRVLDLELVALYDTPRVRLPETWKLTEICLTLKEAGSPSPAPMLPLVRQLSSTLQKLLMDVSDRWRPRPAFAPFIHLPKLTELTCTRMGNFVLEHIAAPKLERLVIITNEYSFPDSVFTHLRTFKALSELSLVDVIWDADSLLSTLRALPTLTTLKITENAQEIAQQCVTAALLSGLTRGGVDVDGVLTPPNPTCPLPNLTTMLLALFKCETEEEAELVAPLRTMALSRPPSESIDDAELRPLDVFGVVYAASASHPATPSWRGGLKAVP